MPTLMARRTEGRRRSCTIEVYNVLARDNHVLESTLNMPSYRSEIANIQHKRRCAIGPTPTSLSLREVELARLVIYHDLHRVCKPLDNLHSDR